MLSLLLTVVPYTDCQRDWAWLQFPLPGQAGSLVGFTMLLFCMIYDCLCRSATLINIQAHTLNLIYTVLIASYILPAVS